MKGFVLQEDFREDPK